MCTQRNNNKKAEKEEEGDKVTTVSVWIHTMNAKSEMRLKRKKGRKGVQREEKVSSPKYDDQTRAVCYLITLWCEYVYRQSERLLMFYLNILLVFLL